jgi:RimJ/RimL family protein N-acetyltransferase
MSNLVLATERLNLRQMTTHDVSNLVQIFSDPVAMQYYPSTMTEEEAMGWIRRTLHNYHTYGVGFWVLEEKTTGRFLGQCGIIPQELDGLLQMEIAYLLVRREWGHGYATEAAAACKQHGFGTMGFQTLTLANRLEFDAVVVADAAESVYGGGHDRFLLYTGVTRAVHRL